MKRTSMEILMIAGLSAALWAAAVQAEETMPVMDLQLGASSLAMVVPDSFIEGDKTDEDVEDGLVAYYYSEELLLDFDVYEFEKEGPDTIEAYLELECADFEGTDFKVEDINGFTVASYHAIEEDSGEEYETITYGMEDNGEYLEVVFWLDGENAEEIAEFIMGSLKQQETIVLPIGDSCYSITVPDDYRAGYMTEDDIADDQVGYYYSKSTLLDFDLYVFSKEDEPKELEEYLNKEAAEYDSSNLRIEEINGITVAAYDAYEKSGRRTFPTATYIMEDGDNYVEVVFWRDGVVAAKQAEAIIKTLSKA